MAKIYKYANGILEKFARNNRKLTAIIRRSQIHRIKVYIMLMAITLTSVSNIFAIPSQENVYCKIDPYMYVTYFGRPQPNYQYFVSRNGEEYPVYCMNLGMKGAEAAPNGYLVNTTVEINDPQLENIVANCYPYKSVEALGLQTIEEAMFASQYAVWCHTANLDMSGFRPINHGYQRVVDAIINIYRSGSYEMKSKNIEFETSEQIIEEFDSKKYYTKELNILDGNFDDIKVEDENVKIIRDVECLKVCVPVEYVKGVYYLKVIIEKQDNEIYLGKSTIQDFQDVVIASGRKTVGQNIMVPFESLDSKVVIVKKDKITNEAIEGVTFLITDKEENEVGKYTTDKNGKIEFNTIEDEFNIKEIEAPNEYIIDSNTYNFKISKNEENIFEFFNEKKQGQINIIKKSKEYNEITALKENTPLSDVSFYIYNEDMEVVDDVTTNEFGIALSKKLPIGKYYIKEYKTKEGYQILEKLIEIEILENEDVINVEVLNNNVNVPKKLPITGR